MGILSWREVYITFSGKEQAEVRKLLEENDIPVKIKVSSARGRLSANLPLGAEPMAVNSSGIDPAGADEYRIFVKKENKEEAMGLLGLSQMR